jgi:hypothetical protein
MNCDKSPLMHKHHIIPRYMGGTDDEQNLVEVSITQHAMFHYCNYQLLNNIEDYVAWRGLSHQISEAEFLIEKFKIFGKIGSDRLHEKLKNNPQLKNEILKKQIESWNKNREKHIEKIRLHQPKAVEAARTPESRKKQIESFKKIGHQQEEKNSQYGTMWIHNIELRTNTKIDKNNPIPNGWKFGRIMDFDLHLKKQKKNEEEKEKKKQKRMDIRRQKIKHYTNWYEKYKTTDFKTFCHITGYNKSQQNLCSMFTNFVESYEPKAKNGHSIKI